MNNDEAYYITKKHTRYYPFCTNGKGEDRFSTNDWHYITKCLYSKEGRWENSMNQVKHNLNEEYHKIVV